MPTTTPAPPAPQLVTIYRDYIRQQLKAQLMPVAEQVVDEAVNAAVRDLHTTLELMQRDLERDFIINLTVDGVKR